MQGARKIGFRVAFVSGEDKSHPAAHLHDWNKRSQGWESPPFPDYPLDMILQFYGVMQLQQIQILSHEYKISRRIDFYIATMSPTSSSSSSLPSKNNNNITNWSNVHWKYLGHINFGIDPSHRDPTVREMKSVKLDAVGNVFKLVIHECVEIAENLCNQVGIVGLTMMGDIDVDLSSKYLKSDDIFGIDLAVMELGIDMEELNIAEFGDYVDPVAARIAAKLTKVLRKTEKEEMFEKAKRIHAAIKEILELGSKIYDFEKEKNGAVSKEEYQTAIAIKTDIDKMWERIHFLANSCTLATPNVVKQSAQQQQQTSSVKLVQPSPTPSIFSRSDHEKAHMALAHSKWSNLNNESEGSPAASVEIPPSPYPPQQPSPSVRDSQNISATPGLESADENDDDDDDGNSMRTLSILKNLFSKAILRDIEDNFGYEKSQDLDSAVRKRVCDAISEISEDILSSQSASRNYAAIWDLFLSMLKRCLGISVPQLFFESLRLLHAGIETCGGMLGDQMLHSRFKSSFISVLSLAIDRAGDTNTRVRISAADAVMYIATHQRIGPSMIVQLITANKQPQKSGGNRARDSWRLIVGHLYLMYRMLDEFGLQSPPSDLNIKHVLPYLVDTLGHHNATVRGIALELVLIIYKEFARDDVIPYLRGVSQAIKNNLNTRMDLIDSDMGGVDETGQLRNMLSMYQGPNPWLDIVPNASHDSGRLSDVLSRSGSLINDDGNGNMNNEEDDEEYDDDPAVNNNEPESVGAESESIMSPIPEGDDTTKKFNDDDKKKDDTNAANEDQKKDDTNAADAVAADKKAEDNNDNDNDVPKVESTPQAPQAPQAQN